MKPFDITCNQCGSQEVSFSIPDRSNKMTIFCDHCPANYTIQLFSNVVKKVKPAEPQQTSFKLVLDN